MTAVAGSARFVAQVPVSIDIEVVLPIPLPTLVRLMDALQAEWPSIAVVAAGTGGSIKFAVDPNERASHDDDRLLDRLQAARADLAELDPGGALERDLGIAISRIRLAERAAHAAVAARTLVRPPDPEVRSCRACGEACVLDDPADPGSWCHAAEWANDAGDHTADIDT